MKKRIIFSNDTSINSINYQFYKFELKEDRFEKLNPNNFNFTFDGKVNLNQEEVLPKEHIDNAKKNIEEKYIKFNN